MTNMTIKKRLPLILTILLNVLLLIFVISLMNYVQKLLFSDTQITLTEVVSQNKDVIASKLMLEVSNLDMEAARIANRLKQHGGISDQNFQLLLSNYMVDAEDEDPAVYLANLDGQAFFFGGQQLDVSDRQYFLHAVQGKQNISVRTRSRLDDNDVFIISVPLLYDDEIMGTVQKIYSPEDMYALCALSLFSSQGHMNVIDSDGYVLISSQQADSRGPSENYIRALTAQGNQAAAKRFAEDIKNDRAGFMEITLFGEKYLSAYAPIEEIHDWYLVCSVSSDAIFSNTRAVIRLFFCILIVIALIVAISFYYFLSSKNKQQSGLRQVAFVDTLTGGDTYNKFAVNLNELLRSNPLAPYSLLSLDIDNFKYVNSFYGFDVGDRILSRIYWDISSKLQSDEMVARISGDHFIVLLEDASPERLAQLVFPVLTEENVTVYISTGLYTIVDRTESVDLMVDKASTAGQTAKGSLNKKVVHYTAQFDQTIMHNEQMKREIEQALANGEIIPFYQPKVDVNTRALVGAEALARWRRSNGTMVSPADFIPLCEKTGQVIALDMAIFESVLQFLSEKLQQGVPCVPISVNFSRLHLIGDEFIHQIMEKITKYQVPPRLIEIELTESVIFDNTEAIIDFTTHLHEHGLQLSIDDFGSGYSSLNMLKDIMVDVLKIDKGFLEDTNNLERQRIILYIIAQMAEKLCMSVVVEGVETEENVSLMKEFGCSVAQGYYFAKPMDVKAFDPIFLAGMVN